MKNITLKKIYSGVNQHIESYAKAKTWVLENIREILEDSEKSPKDVQINIAEEEHLCCCCVQEDSKDAPPPTYFASVRVEIENSGE